jgi:hypothetical protein
MAKQGTSPSTLSKRMGKKRSGKYKKERERMMRLIDEQDIRAKNFPLNEVESDKLI